MSMIGSFADILRLTVAESPSGCELGGERTLDPVEDFPSNDGEELKEQELV